MLEDENVSFVKGKVAKISEEPDSKDLILDVEDTLSRRESAPRIRHGGSGDRRSCPTRPMSRSPSS